MRPSASPATGADSSPRSTAARITANVGIAAVANPVTIDDSLITTVPGPRPETGIGMDPNFASAAVVARHVTIIGSGSPGSTGLSLSAFDAAIPATSTATLDSSIIRGYITSIAAEASSITFPATSTVTVSYSFYDPAIASVSQSGPKASATITRDTHSGNIDPLFVNASTGDFHLRAGSPAIDAGDPAPPAAGESTTDLDGNARAVPGRRGDGAISDIGAFEFQPHPPSVSATAASQKAAVGHLTRLRPPARTPTPVTRSRSRGRSTTARTRPDRPSPMRSRSAGRHTATVTATDLDGFTAAASVAITVSCASDQPARRSPVSA